MIEAAIVTARSNRELAAATMTAAETISVAVHDARTFIDINAQALGLKLDTLNGRIAEFTDKADTGTNRLVAATWALALGTLLLVVATGFLVYAELHAEPPQVVVPIIPKP